MTSETKFKPPSAVGLARGAKGADVEVLQTFLGRYGYLVKASTDATLGTRGVSGLPQVEAGVFDDNTVVALRNYQTFFRLPVSGRLDEVTVAHMGLSRCGAPEPRVRRDLGLAPLFTLFPGGPRWTKRQLTYNFKNFPGSLIEADIRRDVRAAFDIWSAETPLSFVEVNGPSDIEISFGLLENRPENELALGNGPAPTDQPLGSPHGDVEFDITEPWSTANPCSHQEFDFMAAAVHEFGHVLGLNHSDIPGSLMEPLLQNGRRTLRDDDINGIQFLYGPRPQPQLTGSRLQLGGVTSDGKLWHATRFPSEWTPLIDVEAKTGDGGKIADVDVQILGSEVPLCAVNSEGGLWHARRGDDGNWTGLLDIESQIGERGTFERVACTQLNGDELQVLGVTKDGQLLHAARRVSGAWILLNDIKQQAGDQGTVLSVDGAGLDGLMHVCAITRDGRLWHTVGGANGIWSPFSDVEASAGERGSFVDVACIGFGGELHICAVTDDGRLWHTIRVGSGARAQFGDVKSQAGDKGKFSRVSIAAIGDELHVAATTTEAPGSPNDGRLWHTVRAANGTWSQFGDVEAFAGDRGGFIAVGVSGLFVP